MKKLIALMLCIATLLSLSIPASAAGYTPKHTEEANVLYDLGLFKGTGTNSDGTPVFALDRQATRIEGLVMLIRLLGEEDDAVAFAGECPFTDVPSWAEKYAGYAYEKGYTKGTSATTFSDGPLYSNAFLTFVLRSLGYNDTAGDFAYNTACEKAAEVGIIGTGKYADQSKAIYRDNCASISYNALKSNMKDTDTKLMDKLVSDGVLTDAMIQASGILFGKVTIPVTFTKKDDNYSYRFETQDVIAAIPQATYISKCSFGGISPEVFSQTKIDPVYVALGSKLYREYYIAGKRPASSYELPPGSYRGLGGHISDTNVIFSIFDSDLNLRAFAYASTVNEITELTFTVCNYNPKEDIKLKEIEEKIQNIKQLDSDIAYFEKITTVHADGTKKSEVYLRLDETKWPDNVEKPAYYCLVPEYSRELLLMDYGFFHSSVRLFDVAFDAYGTVPKFDANGENLVIYNEAKDVIVYIKLPQNTRVVETKIEQ